MAFTRDFIALVPNLIIAAVVLGLIFIVARFAGLNAHQTLKRFNARPSLLIAIGTIIRLSV